jgi:hypothetical protein
VVDAQAGFSLDGHTREPLRVGFTERTAGSLELPARVAAAAREHRYGILVRSVRFSQVLSARDPRIIQLGLKVAF